MKEEEFKIDDKAEAGILKILEMANKPVSLSKPIPSGMEEIYKENQKFFITLLPELYKLHTAGVDGIRIREEDYYANKGVFVTLPSGVAEIREYIGLKRFAWDRERVENQYLSGYRYLPYDGRRSRAMEFPEIIRVQHLVLTELHDELPKLKDCMAKIARELQEAHEKLLEKIQS